MLFKRLRKREGTNQENPRTIPEQIGKIPEKSGKSQKGRKRTKKEGQVQIGKPPPLNPPPITALEKRSQRFQVTKCKSQVATAFAEKITRKLWKNRVLHENKSDHPTPHVCKTYAPETCQWGSVWHKSPFYKNQGISTENMAYGPPYMAYESPLHTK